MISRRKGHSGTWPPFSPRACKTKPSSSPQTRSPLTLENAPRGSAFAPPRVDLERDPRDRGRPRKKGRKAGEGESSETRCSRRPSPLHHYHHHPLFVLDVSPRRLFRRRRVRDGDLRNRLVARSFDSCRSLARSRGEHRRFSATRKGHRKRARARARSGKKTRVTGAYSYEGRSAEVTGNPAGSSLSRLSPSLRLMLQTDARLSSLIFRVALRRDNHGVFSNENLNFGFDTEREMNKGYHHWRDVLFELILKKINLSYNCRFKYN